MKNRRISLFLVGTLPLIALYVFEPNGSVGKATQVGLTRNPENTLQHLSDTNTFVVVTRDSSRILQKCTSENTSPFSSIFLPPCANDRMGDSNSQYDAMRKGVGRRIEILSRITRVLESLEKPGGNSDPNALLNLILTADQCDANAFGLEISRSAGCSSLVSKRQAAKQSIERAAESGNSQAQFIFGTLLMHDASLAIPASSDPSIGEAEYKRGELFLKSAAAAGDPDAKKALDGLSSMQESSVSDTK